MKKEIIQTPDSLAHLPLSPGVKVGNLLFTSGNVGVDRSTGEIPEGVAQQTRQTLENLRKVLDAAGVGFDDVIKSTVYLTDMENDFAEMNEVYREYFPTDPPARSALGIKALANDKLKVEIELIVLAG